jgi:hypothetical protein
LKAGSTEVLAIIYSEHIGGKAIVLHAETVLHWIHAKHKAALSGNCFKKQLRNLSHCQARIPAARNAWLVD